MQLCIVYELGSVVDQLLLLRSLSQVKHVYSEDLLRDSGVYNIHDCRLMFLRIVVIHDLPNRDEGFIWGIILLFCPPWFRS